jgi:hypothetical protein
VEAKKQLILNYIPKYDKQFAVREMHKLRQKADKTVGEFSDRAERLWSLVSDDKKMEEDDLLNYTFIQGLVDENMKIQVGRRETKNFIEVVAAAKIEEKLFRLYRGKNKLEEEFNEKMKLHKEFSRYGSHTRDYMVGQEDRGSDRRKYADGQGKRNGSRWWRPQQGSR